MNMRIVPLETIAPVDLARENPFRLQHTEVRPSTLELVRRGRTATVEPKVMQVLVTLARHLGQVTSRGELVQACWQGRAVSEDAIGRTIAKLRQSAELQAGGDFVIQTIPRVGFRLSLSGTAPLIEGASPEGASALRRGARAVWVRRVVTVCALLAIVGAVVVWTRHPPVSSVNLGSFSAIGPGVPADLPRRFGETVRDAFGQDNDLTIRSRGADVMLHGVIQRSADRYRYSVRLEDPADGGMIWGSSSELSMADPVAPHRAAVAISQIVRCGLKGAAEYPHRLPRHTLGLYLQYCETYLGLHPSPDHARNLALRIVAESPNFSWGWSALAQAAGALYVGATSNDRAAYLAEVRRASTRAIQLDAHNGQAYEILTYVLPPHAYVEREALLNKAVQAHLTGCGCELVSMGNFLTSVGRTREAKAYFRRAYDLQPFYVPAATGLGLRMDDLGDWQGAELIFARLAETAGGGGLWPSIHASYRDDWSSAQRYVTNVPLPVRPALAQAVEALASGDKRRIAAARPPLEQAASFLQTQRSMASFAVVNALVALGSDDEAFRQLDALAARGATGVLFYAREQALAHDPRYADLLQKYGLMAYWRSSRTRPDLCTHPQAPDFCRRLPRMETSATAPKGVAVT